MADNQERVVLLDPNPVSRELCSRVLAYYDLQMLGEEEGWGEVSKLLPAALVIVSTEVWHWREVLDGCLRQDTPVSVLALVAPEEEEDLLAYGSGLDCLHVYVRPVRAKGFCPQLAQILEETSGTGEFSADDLNAEAEAEVVSSAEVMEDSEAEEADDITELPAAAVVADPESPPDLVAVARENVKLRGQVAQLKSKLQEALKRQREMLGQIRKEMSQGAQTQESERNRLEREVGRLRLDQRTMKEQLEQKRKEVSGFAGEKQEYRQLKEKLTGEVRELQLTLANTEQRLYSLTQEREKDGARIERLGELEAQLPTLRTPAQGA